jgi:NADH-quinone oxidoreductase subunit L
MSSLPIAVWLLVLAPVSALLLGFFVLRPLKPRWTHWPILASCLAVSASAAWLLAWVHAGRGLDVPIYTWMITERWGIPFGVRVDGVGASVLAMVAVVGTLIHVYAAAYMKDDPGLPRFILLFHLFFLAMVGLLMSNNYVQLYLFWELVGAVSYLLIGYWHHKESARRASLQAFLVNRVGDFGLMLAVLILAGRFFGNTRFHLLPQFTAALASEETAVIGWLLFWAATAKSAQFPLYFWLPDAMEGPTPVSALMHAATMVTAGIFLLARSWPLISVVPHLPETIAWVGALTCLGAALIACTKTDLKRILAYSTVSHLGLMTFALGLGQVGAAVFHLVTHGFFKAALFLCAGNIAHAIGKPTATVSEVGGLRRELPVTFACFTAAALSACGLWPLAGFYSKDAILDAAFHHGPVFAAAGVLIAFISAFYMGRMLFLAFFGDRPEQKRSGHPHEVGPVMAVPVVFLSLGAVGAGWLSGGLMKTMLSGWPNPADVPSLPEFSWTVFSMGTGAALLGLAAAYFLTMSRPSWDWRWRASYPGLERLFDSDFGWKPAMAGVAAAARWMADLAGRAFDRGLWDRGIEGTAAASQSLSRAGGRLATGSLSDSLWWLTTGAAGLLALAVWK